METKHTPGPWTIEPDDGSDMAITALVDPEHSSTYYAPIAFIEDGWEPKVRAANARLIAAAPDLLAALAECANALARYAHIDERADDAADAARAALARARGEG